MGKTKTDGTGQPRPLSCLVSQVARLVFSSVSSMIQRFSTFPLFKSTKEPAVKESVMNQAAGGASQLASVPDRCTDVDDGSMDTLGSGRCKVPLV